MSMSNSITMPLRKSLRSKKLTTKLEPEQPIIKKRKNDEENNDDLKKLKYDKIDYNDNDRIDPIEKLLSLNNYDHDLNSYLQQDVEESENDDDNEEERRPSVSLNFTKIFNDNLLRHEPYNFINQNSTFALLNHPNVSEPTNSQVAKSEVPFFRLVNFNPKPKQNVIDELLILDDDNDAVDPLEYKNPSTNLTSSDSEDEEIATPKNSPLMTKSKMCFNYRQNDNLNLSNFKPQETELRILNENSIISGKLNETIGSGRFLMNDFFL